MRASIHDVDAAPAGIAAVCDRRQSVAPGTAVCDCWQSVAPGTAVWMRVDAVRIWNVTCFRGMMTRHGSIQTLPTSRMCIEADHVSLTPVVGQPRLVRRSEIERVEYYNHASLATFRLEIRFVSIDPLEQLPFVFCPFSRKSAMASLADHYWPLMEVFETELFRSFVGRTLRSRRQFGGPSGESTG